jgi:enoyl-CoA hydratase/carnithine racemase
VAGAAVATLTFDHGPLNLFDQAMFDSLTANVAALAADPPRARSSGSSRPWSG